jgi:selenocysteine-specific translation elongation factor
MNNSINVSVLGAKGLADKLAKKGTASDITLYNLKKDGKIYTFVEPNLFPEKISALIMSVQLSDFAIVNVNQQEIGPQLGEIIIALDALKKPGFFVLDGVVREQIEPLVKGTVCEKYEYVDSDMNSVWNAINQSKAVYREGDVRVLVDQSFMVKSVGTVVLGIVEQGTVRKYDNLILYPANKDVMIRSIQMQDVDVGDASAGDRIGFALKGADPDDAPRGSIICTKDAVIASKEASVSFVKNRFFREEVPKKMMLSLGLQYMQCDFENGVLKTEKPMIFNKGDAFILCDQSKKMRIVGSGYVA